MNKKRVEIRKKKTNTQEGHTVTPSSSRKTINSKITGISEALQSRCAKKVLSAASFPLLLSGLGRGGCY